MEARRLPDRKRAVATVACAIGDHLASGSALIPATGARLARSTRNRAVSDAVIPGQVRIAVGRALAAEAARPRASWPACRDADELQDAAPHTPGPRTATG